MFSASKTAGPSGYNISRSVRLRSSATAYFNRTPGSTSNQTTWTWSGWVKRGKLGAVQGLFGAGNGGTGGGLTAFGFTSSDQIVFYWNSSAGAIGNTTAVFRDPSAWYHIVVSVGSGSAKIYVNNSLLNTFTITGSGLINNASQHAIGAWWDTSYAAVYVPFDGYLTEINFIDGQALTPSSFGSTNATTGVWQPAKYTGTYGTNGFYLNFSDNSAATAAAIGKDYSGNGNNWTPNNISVTAGVTYDSMIDVPTPYADGSTNRGNYAVGNPLYNDTAVASTWSGGNLNYSVGNGGSSEGTFGVTSGKWYWECLVTTGANPGIGVHQATTVGRFVSQISYAVDGTKYVSGTNSAYGASYTTNDVIGIALDMDGGTVTFYKNNVSQGSIALSGASITTGVPFWGSGGSVTQTGSANFGQRPFSYTPPSGFKALNTFNLPATTINNGATVMAATLYTGNGATGQTITNTVNSVSFKPDLVWVKARSNAYDNGLQDSVRGVTKDLNSNNTDAEETRASSITAFASNGFTLGGNDLVYNGSGVTYVGWQWNAGSGSSSSNTSGSITSTVSVNATAGFSVVTYTGTGANATVGHGLGVAPNMVITKRRNSPGGSWLTYHSALGATKYLTLESTSAAGTSALPWNNTAPTSSIVNLGTGNTNDSGGTFVAYCWSEIAGFSKFGSYTGNGSTDGPMIWTGFRPRWVMIKGSSNASSWQLFDTSRNPYNVVDNTLWADLSSAEGTGTARVDLLSNGFKVRAGAGTDPNVVSQTYIYAAFAEVPFQFALGR